MSTLDLNPYLPTERVTLFADVILPLPLPQLFTYRVPHDLNDAIQPGARAVVQFGRRKIVTAVVARLHETAPSRYQAKYILELLDDEPLVNEHQLRFFEWMADYYLCAIGEVMNAALPSGLKISSRSRIQLNPDWDRSGFDLLNEKEGKLIELLEEHESLTYDEAAEKLDVKNIYHILKGLTALRAIILFEELKEKYKPRTIKKVRLVPHHTASEERLQALFEQLESNPKQISVLLSYLQRVPVHANPAYNEKGIEKSELKGTGISASSLATLTKNGVFEEFEVVVSRFPTTGKAEKLKEVVLTEQQTRAREEIIRLFQEKEVTLLHGITGSGKTEVYIDLIRRALDSGSQVLFMLPEIALTTQIVARLQKVFGQEMGIYHSKFSDNERVEVWQSVASGAISFIVGVRSAIFLPFSNLGLIIVDEEHETSYKQFDPAPRYHARDASLVLARQHGARVLLGSATPSIETYHQARTERWGLVEMLQRYGDAQLPEMELADISIEKKQKKLQNGFGTALLDAMRQSMTRHEQVILFQNRRGYSPWLQCQECDHVPRCRQCDVSLTYHQAAQELRCHYCGYHEDVPRTCPECDSPKLMAMGAGTERIEDDLKLLIPEIRVQRMDLDTTRSKNSYQQIIGDFEERNIDVLVGTQMVSKGLDFDHVGLVGIFDADRMLHFPDFRAHERTFQMITQVSGRAGRRDRRGRVIIQTHKPQQAILHKIVQGDFLGLYLDEIREREGFFYPPFAHLIRVTTKCEERKVAFQAATALVNIFSRHLGPSRVMGPEAPVVERIRNQYLQDVLVKLERGKLNLKAVKEMIRREIRTLETERIYKNVRFVVDVDPV
ncbi:replication restart DNA helicase PriA [Catalinimonas alkaloidigena]|uniref:Replication restart protein PriA n=1 Tax=Catalinimonas alkaloidigena TaxID=1075417 RepID=A0A1G8ZLL9_9BACT|nr:primosomal protein N' [Catalinimonas alkaloidigena]SDK16012.1 replication restart DNA helicase PriA [Catalinimonas alkaloidigena]